MLLPPTGMNKHYMAVQQTQTHLHSNGRARGRHAASPWALPRRSFLGFLLHFVRASLDPGRAHHSPLQFGKGWPIGCCSRPLGGREDSRPHTHPVCLVVVALHEHPRAPGGTAAAHLLLPHHEQDVLSGTHGHRLTADADLQAPGWREGTLHLCRLLLQVDAALTHIGHDLPVPAVRQGSGSARGGRSGWAYNPGRDVLVTEEWCLACNLRSSLCRPPAPPTALTAPFWR